MRVAPYEQTIIEIAFRRIILNHHATVRPPFRTFIMVRPTVPDVLHVRTADVRMGVVFTKSPNGVKRAGLLRLLLAPLRHANGIERCLLSGVTRKTFAQTEFFRF